MFTVEVPSTRLERERGEPENPRAAGRLPAAIPRARLVELDDCGGVLVTSNVALLTVTTNTRPTAS